MGKPLGAYPTTKTGPATPKDITGTDLAGDKYGLDVNLAGGSVNAVPSGLTVSGKITVVALNSATWTALPVTALTGRNGVGVQNETAIPIKINFDNTEPGYIGWTINAGGELFLDVKDTVIVYAKSSAGTPSVTVMEIA